MKRKTWNNFRHGVEYLFVQGLLLVLWNVSLKTALTLADGLGRFVFSVLRVRRKVTLKNLADCFPEKSEPERFQIARNTYRNFTKMVFEYMRFPKMKDPDVLGVCTMEGEENAKRALRKGNGGVLVAGHFGNWELMGAFLAKKGYPVSFLVGEQHNRYVDRLMNRCREHMGIKIIHMGVAVRGVLRALRENGFVALLSDQDAGKEGVFVDFFGRPSSTHQGPAVFALKTGAPVLFGSAIRLPYGRHHIVAELLDFSHLTEVTPENIRIVTQAYTALLEKAVRSHPDHWFWMHKRWKTSQVSIS
jgi:KDO2-lipid IV(A) lauroyltransferase